MVMYECLMSDALELIALLLPLGWFLRATAITFLFTLREILRKIRTPYR